MHYSVKKEYMVRTPILPESTFKQTFESSDNGSVVEELIKLSENRTIQEAILVSSPSLYRSLSVLKNDKRSGKKFRQTIESLSRFINRMTTRATPYGLFATVTFKNQGSAIQDGVANQLHKKVHVDYNWLSEVCSSLESDESLFSDLLIKWNGLAITRGDRIALQYTSGWGHRELVEGSQESFIRKILIVTQIKSACQKQISIRELLSVLRKRFTNLNPNQITKVVKELIESEFLLTNLRPNIVDTNDFVKLMHQVEEISSLNPILHRLKYIQTLIDNYERTDLGEGIASYKKLREEMKSVAASPRYLKVDLISTNSSAQTAPLSKVENAVNHMINLTPSQNRFPEIKAFLEKFVEKYGESRKVSLLEVLDPEQGCGSPYDKRLKSDNYIDSQEEKIATAEWISRIEKAISDKVRFIELKNETETKYHANLSRGFEIFTAQCSDSRSSEAKYRILPNTGSDMDGKAAGRFKTIDKQLEVQQSSVSVELVELFRNRNFLNVSRNANNHQYETAIGTNTPADKTEVRLEDILVGVEWGTRGRRFFFESGKTHTHLKFYVTSMINYESSRIFSAIGRFLLEASMYEIDNPFFIPNLLNNANEYPYLPGN